MTAATLKPAKWRHGNLSLSGLDKDLVWVQQAADGWYAKGEVGKYRLQVQTGPWDTQQQAEEALVDGLFHVEDGGNGV